jgi:hypothetical protein
MIKLELMVSDVTYYIYYQLKKNIVCLCNVGLLLLLTLSSCSSVKNEAKQVKTNQGQYPEDIVMSAMLARDLCRETYPALKNSMDESFAIFQRNNQSYFEDAQRDPKFPEHFLSFRRYFDDPDDQVVSEAGCQEVKELMKKQLIKSDHIDFSV